MDVDVVVGAAGFGFENPFPPLSVMVNPRMEPSVQATVTVATLPLTPVVSMDSGIASPAVTCTEDEVNSVITGGATTATVTLEGCPPAPVATETLVVGFVTVSV